MLTTRTYKLLGRFYRACGSLGIVPFKWDPKTNRLKGYSRRSLSILPCVLFCVWGICNSALCVYAAIVAVRESLPRMSLVTDLLYGLLWVAISGYSVALLRSGESICFVLNGYTQFDSVLSEKVRVQKSGSKRWPLLDLILLATVPACGFVGFAASALFIAFPYSHRYPLRYLLGRRPKLYEVLLWAPVDFIGPFTGVFMLFAFVLPMLLACMVTNHWVKVLTKTSEIRKPLETEGQRSQSDQVGSPPETLNFYRTLCVLCKAYNSLMAYLPMSATMLIVTGAHSLCAFTSIKYFGVIPMPGYLLFPYLTIFGYILDFVIFLPMGKVQEVSESFLVSWQDASTFQKHAGFRKELRSFSPLGVMIGSVYQVHKRTVLFLLMAVGNAVVNAALIF